MISPVISETLKKLLLKKVNQSWKTYTKKQHFILYENIRMAQVQTEEHVMRSGTCSDGGYTAALSVCRSLKHCNSSGEGEEDEDEED